MTVLTLTVLKYFMSWFQGLCIQLPVLESQRNIPSCFGCSDWLTSFLSIRGFDFSPSACLCLHNTKPKRCLPKPIACLPLIRQLVRLSVDTTEVFLRNLKEIFKSSHAEIFHFYYSWHGKSITLNYKEKLLNIWYLEL